VATALAPLPEAAPERLPTLRFITCGSVDDGKSTLLGRLLHDANALASDQLETLATDSARRTRDGEPDYALLLDGLEAEREQGITIDVAYRYFASERRAFIVADTPGHEQYTRNMVTGASTADLAVILVDATRGVQRQTRRHSRIVRLLGIRHVVLAVNKMDLVGFDHARFDAIVADYRALAEQVGIARFTAVPVVARDGDMVVGRGARMPWHRGPTIIEALDTAEVAEVPDAGFAMPVQSVLRPDATFRGYAGRVAAGRVAPGQALRVLPAGTRATVARVVAPEGDRAGANAGESALLTFAHEVDCSRGDVLVGERSSVGVADEIGATCVWMTDEPLSVGRRMLLKLGTRTVPARVTGVESVFDPDTGDAAPPREVRLNDIARATLVADQPIALDLYERSRALGGFILIDPHSNATAAAGLIDRFALRRAATGAPAIRWIEAEGDQLAATGAALAERLRAEGHAAVLLDEARLADLTLGADAAEAARRAIAAAQLLHDAGLAVVLALPPVEGVRWPGERVTAAALDAPAPDWVI